MSGLMRLCVVAQKGGEGISDTIHRCVGKHYAKANEDGSGGGDRLACLGRTLPTRTYTYTYAIEYFCLLHTKVSNCVFERTIGGWFVLPERGRGKASARASKEMLNRL